MWRFHIANVLEAQMVQWCLMEGESIEFKGRLWVTKFTVCERHSYLVGIHLVLVLLGKDLGHGDGHGVANDGDGNGVTDQDTQVAQLGQPRGRNSEVEMTRNTS